MINHLASEDPGGSLLFDSFGNSDHLAFPSSDCLIAEPFRVKPFTPSSLSSEKNKTDLICVLQSSEHPRSVSAGAGLSLPSFKRDLSVTQHWLYFIFCHSKLFVSSVPCTLSEPF